jgi:hypothetical protein
MSEILAHPLVLLVIGAALTGVLIPFFTRQWQDRQKELELKTALVSELSEAIMEIVMAVQFIVVGLPGSDEDQAKQTREVNDAYRTWEIKSAVIGTKLQAYFPTSSLPSSWTEFSHLVTLFYARIGIEKPDRPSADHELREKLNEMLRTLGSRYTLGETWGDLKNGVLEAKSALIQQVLQQPIAAIGSTR